MNRSTSTQSTPRRLKIPLGAFLVLLSLASVLPLIALSIYELSQFETRTRHVDRERIVGSEINLSSAIDRDIESLVALGAALATSPSLSNSDFTAFHREAEFAIKYTQANVILLDRSLRQLVNTRVPHGTPLPKTSNPENAASVFKNNKIEVSAIFTGGVSKRQVFNVSIPVNFENEVRYVLIVTAEPERIRKLIDAFWLPDGWFAAVSDQERLVFASTSGALDGTLSQMPQGMSTTASTVDGDVQGKAAIISSQKSALTNWTTYVWAPHASLDAPLKATWDSLFAASVFAVSLGAIFAYAFQLPFANLIRQTVAAAAHLGKPSELPEIKSFLAEGQSIRENLIDAARELRESNREAAEGKALLDTLLAHVPEGITIVGGADFRVIANSRKAIEMAGRPESNLRVLANDHAESFGIWFTDGKTRPEITQLPLYRASRIGESIAEEYYLVRRPDGTEITIEVTVNPVRDTNGTIIGAISCWRDVTQRNALERLVADNEKRLQLALRVAGMAMIDIDLEEGVVTGISNGAANLGLEGVVGDSVRNAMAKLREPIHPDDRARVAANQQLALTTVGPFSDEYRIITADGKTAWIETRGETIADDSGKVSRLLGTNIDITARKQADELLQLVQRELTHRAKNLLTVILGIASQTARRNTTVDEFMQSFSQRIRGLGSSHDLLVHRAWTSVPLAELVQAQLAPFGDIDGKRISVEGSPLNLKIDVLQSLGLALHELATNATKYGALSVPGGVVRIAWKVKQTRSGQRFQMTWKESGGPPVKPPQSKGFGHVIIERSTAQVVNGDVKLQFAATGLVWSLDAPLAEIVAA